MVCPSGTALIACAVALVPSSNGALSPSSFAVAVAVAWDDTATPMLTFTFVSSSAGTGAFCDPSVGWPFLARRRAARRSARPMRTSRTRTVAGSRPNTFCENTRKTSTRSSPCNCSSKDRGESGRMNVRESPSAVRYVPAKSSTFSPLSPQRMARKLSLLSTWYL